MVLIGAASEQCPQSVANIWNHFQHKSEARLTFSERGCPAAALRVWPWKTTEKTPIELCGDTLDTYKQILSETNVLQMSFYLADKAVGAKGFKATWTEIKVK